MLFKDTLDLHETRRETSTQQKPSSPFPPSDIKGDLQAIFEQYSSLNAVKKLTSTKVEKKSLFQKRKQAENHAAQIPKIESKEQPIPIKEKEDEVIFDATYRQITEEEKLAEIKEELKKQLKEELEQQALVKEEEKNKEELSQSIQTLRNELKRELEEKLQEKLVSEAEQKEEEKNKEDFLNQSIQTLRNELKKELEEKLQEKLASEAEKEEVAQKLPEIKEELIKSLKIEILESLKEELKKEIIIPEQKIQKEEPKINQEDIKKMSELLRTLNNTVKCTSTMFLDYSGNLLVRGETDKRVIQEDSCKVIGNLFSTINKNIASTNQGKLLHVLLESEDGTLALAELKSKMLVMSTEGTGEGSSAQILRALSDLEGS